MKRGTNKVRGCHGFGYDKASESWVNEDGKIPHYLLKDSWDCSSAEPRKSEKVSVIWRAFPAKKKSESQLSLRALIWKLTVSTARSHTQLTSSKLNPRSTQSKVKSTKKRQSQESRASDSAMQSWTALTHPAKLSLKCNQTSSSRRPDPGTIAHSTRINCRHISLSGSPAICFAFTLASSQTKWRIGFQGEDETSELFK